MLRLFRQVDVFTSDAVPGQPGRRRARRRGPVHRGDAAVRALDEPLRDHVRAAADRRRRRTTGSGSSRPSPSCRSPGIRRSAPATRGCRPAAPRRPATSSSRSARPGWSRSAVRRTGWRSPRRRCSAPGPVDDDVMTARRGGARHRPGRRSWPPSGSTTGRAGSALLLRERRGGRSRCAPASSTSTSAWSGRIRPDRRQAFEVRAFFPKDGSTVEDPVTGSLNASLAQWLLGTGPAPGAVRGQPGHGPGPGRAGPRHARRRRHDLGRRRHGHLRHGRGRSVARVDATGQMDHGPAAGARVPRCAYIT